MTILTNQEHIERYGILVLKKRLVMQINQKNIEYLQDYIVMKMIH